MNPQHPEPEASGPDTPESAIEPTGLPDQPEAGSEGTPTDGGSGADAEVLSSFRLDDVDEAYRADVERYVKQVQGDYTRKTQALSEREREVERALQFQQAIENEDTYEDALDAFLEANGLRRASDGTVVPADAAGDADENQVTSLDDLEDDPLAAHVRQLQQRIEDADAQRAEQDQAREAEEHKAAVVNHVTSHLSAYAEKVGGALDDDTRDLIIARAAQMPFREDGLPDIEAAITAHEAWEARRVQKYLDSKRGPTADASGSLGVPAFDPSNQRERLDAAMAIAGRHFGD